MTREPEVAKQQSCMNPRSLRADDIDHVKERTWILSWYSGDQLWQLMVITSCARQRETRQVELSVSSSTVVR